MASILKVDGRSGFRSGWARVQNASCLLKQATVSPDVPAEQLQRQHNGLSDYVVAEQGSLRLYCAPGERLGCILEQIAIAREHAFRGVNQGTGQELDTDIFDELYWHVWIWDEEHQRIAGAYRAVNAGKLIREHGIETLYSNSLFCFQQKFEEKLEHMVELGRSFVASEYQKEPRILDLLWRGICEFLLQNPRCHTFIGGVSISPEYTSDSKAFLSEAFMQHFCAPLETVQLVEPRYPFESASCPFMSSMARECSTVALLNSTLSTLQPGKSVPVLIRRYLSLNAKFLSFVVNPSMGSLDGLSLLDVRQAPRRYRERYLGNSGKRAFDYRWGI